MKKTLLSAATAVALTMAASSAAAHDHDHACLDDLCQLQSLFQADAPSGGSADAPIAAQRMGSWGIDTAGMDTSVRPGEDFFRYVSGTWAETTEIPSDKSSYGAFLILRDLSEARVRQLVEGYRTDDAANADRAKVATLYAGFMDQAAIEAASARCSRAEITPIEPPCNSTNRLARARPTPCPSTVERSRPRRLKGSNSCACF